MAPPHNRNYHKPVNPSFPHVPREKKGAGWMPQHVLFVPAFKRRFLRHPH